MRSQRFSLLRSARAESALASQLSLEEPDLSWIEGYLFACVLSSLISSCKVTLLQFIWFSFAVRMGKYFFLLFTP